MRNLLLLTIFKDDEIAFGQIRNVVPGFVRHGRDHINESDIDLQLSGDDRDKKEGKKQSQSQPTHWNYTLHGREAF